MKTSKLCVLGGVFAFTVPAGGLDSAELVFNYASPGASFRIDRCRVVTADL